MDSFEGLPDSRAEKTRGWAKGKYAADPRQALTAELGKDRVDFVAGFYDRSLTPGLARARNMRPALYVDVDCDLYESSVAALEWVFRSGLAAPGTLVGYDDWCLNT